MFINFCSSCSRSLVLRSSSIRQDNLNIFISNNFIKSKIFISILNRSFQTTKQVTALRRNYYEILGLKTDCSQKEIRDAFVVLSKEHHPDLAPNKIVAGDATSLKSNQEFIQVVEAYQVLSKSHSRANYDLSLKGIDTVNYIRRDTFYEPWKVDPMSYSEKGPNYSPYYGVRGFKRVENWKVVAACVLFCVFGAMIQGFVIMRSTRIYRREVTDHKSAMNISHYEEARETAGKNGNAVQLEMMKKRLKRSHLEVDQGDF